MIINNILTKAQKGGGKRCQKDVNVEIVAVEIVTIEAVDLTHVELHYSY